MKSKDTVKINDRKLYIKIGKFSIAKSKVYHKQEI